MQRLIALLLSVALVFLPAHGSQNFTNASSQAATVTISNTNVPVFVACWVKPTSIINNMIVFCFNAGATRCFYVNVAGTKIQAVTADTQSAVSSADLVTGSWQHVVAGFISTSSRSIWLNGSKNSNTGTQSASNATRFTVAAQSTDGTTVSLTPFDGLIAEISIHGSLTDAQVASLYAGAPPESIQPFYGRYRLAGGVLINTTGGVLTNLNSSTTNADHPRVYR